MEKPSAVSADEFRQGVAYLANNSGLPAFVVSMILAELTNEAKGLAMQELRQSNDEWNKFCKEQEKEERIEKDDHE